MFSPSLSPSSCLSCVGSIDQGTSSTRFVLFSVADGSIVDYSQLELTQIHFDAPERNGWAEHDPMEILIAIRQCIDTVMKRNPTVQLMSVGITNQRETCLVWDSISGQPIHNALVWHDSRTSKLVEEFSAKFGGPNHFRPSCGLPISTYFSALKFVWLLRNIPAVGEAISAGRAKFGTIDSWIIWNLTGGIHVTDVSNASRTMLMNLSSGRWDAENCRAFGVPLSILPEIRSSSEVYGRFADGILKGIPIAGCLGDQQSALFGQLCLKPGQAKNTYGTGCFLLMNTGNEPIQSNHGLLTTAAFQLGPDQPIFYALEGSIAVSGSAMRWLRDEVKLFSSYSELPELVASVNDNGDCYFVPAFSGLLSPHWRTDARGLIAGITHSTSRGHIVRAAIESSAFQTRDVLRAMESDSGVRLTSLHVDGGLCQSDYLMQFQADLIDLPVVRPAMLECTAAGAAFVAGLAVGAWRSVEEIKEKTYKNRPFVFESRIDDANRERLSNNWSKAVNKSFGWVEGKPASTHSNSKSLHRSKSSLLNSFALLSCGLVIGSLVTMKFLSKK